LMGYMGFACLTNDFNCARHLQTQLGLKCNCIRLCRCVKFSLDIQSGYN
jgi:hypothetical protein